MMSCQFFRLLKGLKGLQALEGYLASTWHPLLLFPTALLSKSSGHSGLSLGAGASHPLPRESWPESGPLCLSRIDYKHAN